MKQILYNNQLRASARWSPPQPQNTLTGVQLTALLAGRINWTTDTERGLAMSRMEQLQEMLKSEPDDAFLNYALALEFDKADQHDDALKLFEKLTQFEPPYVPAFFMAGQMLSRIDRGEEAEKFLTEGITHAKTQGNGHAAGEMSEFLAMIRDL